MERNGNNNGSHDYFRETEEDYLQVPIDHEQIGSEVVAEGERRAIRKKLREIQSLSTHGSAPTELLMEVLTPEEIDEKYQDTIRNSDATILGLGEEFVRSYAVRRAFVARYGDRMLGGVFTTGHYYSPDISS
jgi:hypothetical protein